MHIQYLCRVSSEILFACRLGAMEMPDGQTYTGHFVNWTRHGNGNLTWRNGDLFEGQWTNDEDGKGTITYSDGTVYVGEWRNDKRHGNGEMTYVYQLFLKKLGFSYLSIFEKVHSWRNIRRRFQGRP